MWLTPAQAKSRQLTHTTLTKQEVTQLEALAEVILPGSSQAGISHFIDQQLSAPLEQCLLIIRYLGVPYPFQGFYQASLTAIKQLCQNRYDKLFSELNSEQANTFIKEISASNPSDWQGPPAPFFYYVLRSDVIDVVYGTQEGFEKLNIPYMAHIAPEQDW